MLYQNNHIYTETNKEVKQNKNRLDQSIACDDSTDCLHSVAVNKKNSVALKLWHCNPFLPWGILWP